MVYISEPNLYRLIIKSRLPTAEAFEAWLMEVVLPTLRKTQRYEMPSASQNVHALQEDVDALHARLSYLENRKMNAKKHSELILPQSDTPLVALFWNVYQELTQKGILLNHSINPELIAINLNDFFSMASDKTSLLMSQNALKVQLKQSYSFPFIANNIATRSSIHNGRILKCWLFKQRRKHELIEYKYICSS